MRIEITIGNRQVLLILLFIIAASAVGLVVAYQSSYTPDIMGHSWGEMECNNCITNPNLADNSVTGAKIQDGSITTADISPTATVPNADKVGGAAIGNSLYAQAAGCGGGLSTSATCSTSQCYNDGYNPVVYYSCNGACDTSCMWYGTCTQPSCQNTYWGRLLA